MSTDQILIADNIKEALLDFLEEAPEAEIDQSSDESEINGSNRIVSVRIIAPCRATSNYWSVNIFPRISVELGTCSNSIHQSIWEEAGVVEYLSSQRESIYKILLYILSNDHRDLYFK